MELDQLLRNRRSVRHYLNKEVPRDMLESLIKAAQEAPVSCNLQLTRYVVVDDKELLVKLKNQVSYKFGYAPVCILVLYDPRFTVERQSVVSSAAMAAENILLKAVDIGLSTCPMSGFNKDDRIKKILGIPQDIKILMIISVGFSDNHFGNITPFRLEIKDVVGWNRYGNLKKINSSPRLTDHSIKDIIDYRSLISTVYLDRFRLNTYSEKIYEKVFSVFKKYYSDLNLHKVIDVVSYDGLFLRYLNNLDSISLTSSDYLPKCLNFFKETFNCEVVLLDSSNKFVGIDKNYDAATFVFQAEFNPDLESIIKNTSLVLKKQGIFFIAFVQESFYRRIAKWIKLIHTKYLLHKAVNIYENNPFYKIGPRVELSIKDVESICSRNNLNLLSREDFKTENLGRTLEILVFTKVS